MEIILEILTVVAAICGLGTGFFQFKSARKKNKELNQAKDEMDFHKETLSFTDFLEEWNEIHEELKKLTEDTKIDRFLILRAWNGSLTPKWTTAIYQYRQGNQKPIAYIHFELDKDYVERLNYIINHGLMTFSVDQLPESAIKGVYQAEDVKHSGWFHLDKKCLKAKPDCCSITYCSFATHSEEAIDEKSITRCRILVSRLKGIMAENDKRKM